MLRVDERFAEQATLRGNLCDRIAVILVTHADFVEPSHFMPLVCVAKTALSNIRGDDHACQSIFLFAIVEVIA